MQMPRVLRMDWMTFDAQPDYVRVALVEELEKFMAEADMDAFEGFTAEEHPNRDYEYQPLVAVQNKGNYRR